MPNAAIDQRTLLENVKIVALATGLRMSEDVLRRYGGHDALTVHEYATTGGVTLVLPDDVLVNAPFDEPFCAASPLELVNAGDALELRLGDRVVPVVDLLPLPGYLGVVAADGAPAAATTMSHADRIRVSPIDGCSYNCGFCNLPGTYRPHPVEQVLAGIDVALRDDALPARHLLISGGSPSRAQPQLDYFRDVCVGILRHVRRVTEGRAGGFTTDIMMSARADGPAFVEQMAAEGCDGFSLNVEAFSEEGATRHLPLKHKLARPHLEAMVRHAVAIYGRGSGKVRSLIIPGLEKSEQTLEGVEWLASLGCHPVISPFRPARNTKLHAAPTVAPDVLRVVLEESRRIVRRHGVTLGPRCVACQHNILSFPWDLEPREVL
ncbi:MAG: radical SAM protein [Solirubrobacteraceae bacterium]